VWADVGYLNEAALHGLLRAEIICHTGFQPETVQAKNNSYKPMTNLLKAVLVDLE